MKKIAAIIFTFVVFSFSTAASANAPQSAPAQPNSKSSKRLTSTIDNIEVPDEVLIQVQMDYQGYAVTKASKLIINGQPHYRLRVDKDDIADDYESTYLLYDKKWKRLKEEKLVAPPVYIAAPPAENKPEVTPENPVAADDNTVETPNPRTQPTEPTEPAPTEPPEGPSEPTEPAPTEPPEETQPTPTNQ